MKKCWILCALALTLLLTACGGQTADEPAAEPEKDHYYQILDADGQELYTVTDDTAVAEIDALINEAGGESADHGSAEGDPGSGSISFVPGVAGLLAAGEVVKDILTDKTQK